MALVTCRGDLHMADALAGSALPCLDILTLKCPSQTTVTELTDSPNISRSPSILSIHPRTTEKCVSSTDSALSSEPASPTMEAPRRKSMVPSTSRSPDSSHRYSAGARTTSSRPSSAANSIHHSRSNSRSTARSRPPSRHSSFHSSRRSANASIVPVPPSRINPLDKRESLLALHRESCRLFQDQEHQSLPKFSIDEGRPAPYSAPSTSYKSRRDGRTSSEHDYSAPSSPMGSSHSTWHYDPAHRGSVGSMTTPHFLQYRDRSNTMPTNHGSVHGHSHGYSPSASSIHVPATVMEWTSPSTRRAEYEKIDRASRGVRGLWRRVAPRWCQSRDSRTPFFEEGKSKTDREGSVRRFRMDLPDVEESDRSNPRAQLESWHKRRTCRRSKTSS